MGFGLGLKVNEENSSTVDTMWDYEVLGSLGDKTPSEISLGNQFTGSCNHWLHETAVTVGLTGFFVFCFFWSGGGKERDRPYLVLISVFPKTLPYAVERTLGFVILFRVLAPVMQFADFLEEHTHTL